jgi:hypothetical protein
MTIASEVLRGLKAYSSDYLLIFFYGMMELS